MLEFKVWTCEPDCDSVILHLWWFKYQQLGYYYAPIFTTRLANVINLVSSCPLTLAASRKKCSLLGFCCLQHDTSFTATTVHNEFRVSRSNMHQYTEMHLQFLAPCGPPHSHIHTEFDIQAIYSWCCNLSLFKWGFGGWQKELKGAEFEIFYGQFHSHRWLLNIKKKNTKFSLKAFQYYLKMSCMLLHFTTEMTQWQWHSETMELAELVTGFANDSKSPALPRINKQF